MKKKKEKNLQSSGLNVLTTSIGPLLEIKDSGPPARGGHARAAFTLAEGATHVGIFDSCRRVAFTLAEVLITLAIIGVVAAMTIPTLIQNYQKQMYVAKLQKAMSVLNNGFKLMMAEEGIEVFDFLSLSTCRDEALSVIGADETERACIHSKMSKYFKIIDYNKTSDYSDESFYPFKSIKNLNGETTSALLQMFLVPAYYSFVTTDNVLYQPFSTVWSVIDVNGKDAPNQLGRDIFMITHDDYGHFTLQGKGGEWKKESSSLYCDDALTGDGQGCGARIKEEGWKMNY